MTLPQALIFDVDGTLADTERDAHRVAFNQALHTAAVGGHHPFASRRRAIDTAGA